MRLQSQIHLKFVAYWQNYSIFLKVSNYTLPVWLSLLTSLPFPLPTSLNPTHDLFRLQQWKIIFTVFSLIFVSCCSVAKSCLTLWPHGLQHTRLPCPSPSLRVCLNSCPLSQWCHDNQRVVSISASQSLKCIKNQ